MLIVDRSSFLWSYLPDDIKGLVTDGEKLLDHAQKHGASDASDFSYMVFPFAKAYEGFLKRLFLDLDLIREDEFYGDDIRIGRILNPHFDHEPTNIFNRLCGKAGGSKHVADKLWFVWKNGRNQIFHYFPHNFRRLNYHEALNLVQQIADAMKVALANCSIAH